MPQPSMSWCTGLVLTSAPSADHQIQGDLRHAGYIGHWLQCLRDNDKAIFKAAALAEKAASFIQSYQEEEELAAA
jgi:antirestriction protein ArdC